MLQCQNATGMEERLERVTHQRNDFDHLKKQSSATEGNKKQCDWTHYRIGIELGLHQVLKEKKNQMIAKTGTCDNCCDPDSCLKNDLADQSSRSYAACHHHD